MFIRKIGKFLRGNATPFQIVSATVLGALLGSLPGISQSPLLLLILLFLLVVLNANLFLAGITLILFKLVSLLLLPLYFQAGVILLEGPFGAMISVLVNAPVTAWFGLEYYVAVPSLLVGGLGGLLIGFWLSGSIRRFRRRMSELEDGSERYQAYTSKGWVRVLAWLFIGGLKGKKSWSDLAESRKGLPVRPLGIVLVASLCVLGWFVIALMDRTIVTTMVRDSLERANGATVDIEGIDILPGQNRVIVRGLAMADPQALQTNRFESAEIIADISGMSLLAKKIVIDSLQVLEPATGTPRRLAGRRTVEVPETKPVETGEGEVRIEDYVGQAMVWRERLATLKRVYDRIAPYMKKDDAGESAPEGLGWRERLAQRAREQGYASVKSDALVAGSPRLWIRDLQADKLEIGGNDDLFSVVGWNLSSQPALLEEGGRLQIQREDGAMEVVLNLPSAALPERTGVQVRYDNLPVADLEARAGRDLPLDGGSMDITGEGWIENAVLDLPLKVTLRNTTLNAFGSSLPVSELPLEVRLHGPMESPVLTIPRDAIEEAVKSAGKSKIESLIKEKAGDKLKGILPFGG